MSRTHQIICNGSYLALLVFALSCTPAPRIEKTESVPPPKPALSIQVASMNYAVLNRRLEKKDVAQLAAVLKKEQIEVLAVQGLIRYPGVATRVDLLAELAAQADYRTAFGEMMNNSGRQTGNAVFSGFPILSHHTQSFTGVRSASIEAALRATIDAGVQSIHIVSAQLPAKTTADELAHCVRILAELSPSTEPRIISGNLPGTPAAGFSSASAGLRGTSPPNGNSAWYSGAALKAASTRIIQTDIAPLLVTRYDLFRPIP